MIIVNENKMAAEQDFTQTLAMVTQECIITLTKAVEHKKNLTTIIIEETSNDEKLSKLRQTILKYNANRQQGGTDLSSTTAVKLDNLSRDETYLLRMNILADTLESFNNNMKPFSELFDKIANVMRQQDLPAQKKVDAICDLLM